MPFTLYSLISLFSCNSPIFAAIIKLTTVKNVLIGSAKCMAAWFSQPNQWRKLKSRNLTWGWVNYNIFKGVCVEKDEEHVRIKGRKHISLFTSHLTIFSSYSLWPWRKKSSKTNKITKSFSNYLKNNHNRTWRLKMRGFVDLAYKLRLIKF